MPRANEGRESANDRTLVLYMAGRKLTANLDALIARGFRAETPAAYVASATTPSQAVIIGTLADLAARVEIAGTDKALPAVVIVGDVVSVRERIRAANARWSER
jgi:siroheme synthase